jgi:hypothetical protein
MMEKKRSKRWMWLLVPAALLLTYTPATAAPPTVQSELSGGSFLVWTVNDLAPGATSTGHWNNAPQQNSYIVDVRPKGAPIAQACEMEVVRDWESYTALFGSPIFQVWASIKNVGSTTCDADVYLMWAPIS